ncbi:MAG: nucleotide exchange factor GrpE [Longimicrobiales bacterium]
MTRGMVEDTREDGSRAAGLEDDAATNGEGLVPEDEASVISDEIAALQAELADAAARYLRLAADFDNYRRRMERDRADQVARAQTSLIGRLLDVLDDLERVAHHADPNATAQALAQGVELVERKFRQVLVSAGLETVKAENERFDPTTMEAVASVATDTPEEDETVADVFQKGYRLNGILVRPARVRVRKHE